VRQLANVAYSIRAEGLDAEGLEALDVELGMAEDPSAGAREALAEYQRRAGMEFGDPDEPVAGQAAADVPGWMTTDQEFR